MGKSIESNEKVVGKSLEKHEEVMKYKTPVGEQNPTQLNKKPQILQKMRR